MLLIECMQHESTLLSPFRWLREETKFETSTNLKIDNQCDNQESIDNFVYGTITLAAVAMQGNS